MTLDSPSGAYAEHIHFVRARGHMIAPADNLKMPSSSFFRDSIGAQALRGQKKGHEQSGLDQGEQGALRNEPLVDSEGWKRVHAQHCIAAPQIDTRRAPQGLSGAWSRSKIAPTQAGSEAAAEWKRGKGVGVMTVRASGSNDAQSRSMMMTV